jgi:GlcNAc-P-P-Und epimerase
MKRIAWIFGGSGYIGCHLAQRLVQEGRFDHVYQLDLREPVLPCPGAEYRKLDVRQPIEWESVDVDTQASWVFNFAAIHREPGHQAHEYFETNLRGAEHINEFCERLSLKNLFFTSSIAPYGRSRESKTEASLIMPETPYGISKALCEQMHRRWQEREASRRLVITRPAVIYGPHDPGNVLRMLKGVQKGTFFYPGDPSIVKAYGYVHGLVDSMLFTMERTEPAIVYNYTENPVLPLEGMVEAAKKYLGITRATHRVPLGLLVAAAHCVQAVGKTLGKNSPIHPVRVRKAAFPTYIIPQWLMDHGFEFRWGFEKSLAHWREVAPQDFV